MQQASSTPAVPCRVRIQKSGVLQLVLQRPLTSHIPRPVKEFINQQNAKQLKPKVASSAYWSLLEPSQELVWRCGENLTYHAE